MKIEKLYARDLVAFIVLIFGFTLMLKGIDGFITIIIAVVLGSYFSNRFEQENGHGYPLDSKIKKFLNGKNNNQLKPHALSSSEVRKINKEFQKTKEILEP